MTDKNDDYIRTVKLDVLDKEHQSLIAAGQQVHNVLISEIILAVAALAFCFSWIKISSQVSVGGMQVSASQPVLLLISAIAVTVLFWRAADLNAYGARLQKRVMTAYNELGFTDHTDRLGFSGFMYPDLITVASALDSKSIDHLVRQLQKRPARWRNVLCLSVCLWALKHLVPIVLTGLLLILPLVVDVSVAVFAWRHNMNGFVVVATILALGAVYIAGAWTCVQLFDRRESAQMFSEMNEAAQEFFADIEAQKSAHTHTDPGVDTADAISANSDAIT